MVRQRKWYGSGALGCRSHQVHCTRNKQHAEVETHPVLQLPGIEQTERGGGAQQLDTIRLFEQYIAFPSDMLCVAGHSLASRFAQHPMMYVRQCIPPASLLPVQVTETSSKYAYNTDSDADDAVLGPMDD